MQNKHDTDRDTTAKTRSQKDQWSDMIDREADKFERQAIMRESFGRTLRQN